MNQIDLKEILSKSFPNFKLNSWFNRNLTLPLIEKILQIKKINEFLREHNDKKNEQFIDAIFDYLNFSYSISDKDLQKIPSEGKVIIVANHPLGALDALALIKAVRKIRPDVKIVANEILQNIENISELILPFDIFSKKTQKEKIENILLTLAHDYALIIFPAGEVSRSKIINIKDGKWNKGAIYLAKKSGAPILPVYIKAKNTFLFYLVSLINKRLSTALLPRELFKQRNKTIHLIVGDLIPVKSLQHNLKDIQIAKLLKKHLYRIGRGKKGLYVTEKNVVHPVDKKILKSELYGSQILGETPDYKKIFLCDGDKCENVLQEIGRLREVTFRKVGEGTGKKIDLDRYDKYYNHIVLWDELNLEISGSYRLCKCDEVIKNIGVGGLYTASLYKFDDGFVGDILSNAIELGRSFTQQKYWNTMALDNLWQGIGAFVASNPKYRYLIGAVSISASYPDEAKELIVFYFKKWFYNKESKVQSYAPYIISQKKENALSQIFTGTDYKEDYKILKKYLKMYNSAVPILYKHYTDLVDYGGANFYAFSVDEAFSDCIDGLLVVDLTKLKSEKKQRYVEKYAVQNSNNF